ncbi:MAG: hypothetical protein DRR08_08430 [Candidatus Parabeggiatoa sp. nov. 2]|nr:MAG: hypothetical protein B6247_16900 [Beggiatoa sp. 4572_84]RKZ61574.1 MAG: hypothetical protein DRR08_08430 [Gammaproteobacteria bacterium]HEC85132.1 hypothetical protein [Thioploca sp.]
MGHFNRLHWLPLKNKNTSNRAMLCLNGRHWRTAKKPKYNLDVHLFQWPTLAHTVFHLDVAIGKNGCLNRRH